MLNLHDDVVGIVELQLRDRWIRIGTHADVALDAVRLQQFDDARCIEAVHAEAEVIDPVAPAEAALALGERDEFGTGSDRQHRHDRLLPVRLDALHAGDRHAENPLIELERALQVGNRKVQVIEAADRNRRDTGLGDGTRRNQQSRQRGEELSAVRARRFTHWGAPRRGRTIRGVWGLE